MPIRRGCGEISSVLCTVDSVAVSGVTEMMKRDVKKRWGMWAVRVVKLKQCWQHRRYQAVPRATTVVVLPTLPPRLLLQKAGFGPCAGPVMFAAPVRSAAVHTYMYLARLFLLDGAARRSCRVPHKECLRSSAG